MSNTSVELMGRSAGWDTVRRGRAGSRGHALRRRAVIQPCEGIGAAKARRGRRDSGQEPLGSQGVAFYFFWMDYILLKWRLIFSGMWIMIYFCQMSVLFWIAICMPYNFSHMYSLEKNYNFWYNDMPISSWESSRESKNREIRSFTMLREDIFILPP